MIKPTIFNRVFEQRDHEECYNKLINGSWNFCGYSGSDSPTTFWFMDLNNNPFFTDVFFQKIQRLTNKQFILHRVYANGQTHGLSGSLHIDDEDEKGYTFLYYANPSWNTAWGGGTLFWESEECHYTQHFIPNTGILFKANIPHAGLEPTRHCYELRITVAFKLSEIN